MTMLRVKRSNAPTKSGLVSAILTYLPGAWINPSSKDLVALYRLRYKMAMEEKKYDAALIFLNKILEVEPMNLEAKLSKGELFHRHLHDYSRAVEQYNKVIKLTSSDQTDRLHLRARSSMAEIMELLS